MSHEPTAVDRPPVLADHRASRKVRAGSPPPSGERAELRAASKHGPYSYGAPPNSARTPLEDAYEERLQSGLKRNERAAKAAARAPFVWGLGLVIFLFIASKVF